MYSYHQGSFELHKLNSLAVSASQESHTFWARCELKRDVKKLIVGDNFSDYIISKLLKEFVGFCGSAFCKVFMVCCTNQHTLAQTHILHAFNGNREYNVRLCNQWTMGRIGLTIFYIFLIASNPHK